MSPSHKLFLVESLVLILFFSGTSFWIGQKFFKTSTSIQQKELNPFQKGLWILEDDLESAGFDPRWKEMKREPISPIEDPQMYSLRMKGDFNTDGKLGGTREGDFSEEVFYSYDEKQKILFRNHQALLREVSEFSFQYFDGEGKEILGSKTDLSSLKSIQKIRIQGMGRSSQGSLERFEKGVKVKNG